MSLSAREQHELESIEGSLCRSDPRLASMLATFARLNAGEEMPVRERIQASWRRAGGRQRRRPPGVRHAPARRPPTWRRADWQRVAPVLWVLIAVGLIAGALAANVGGGSRGCTVPSAVCAGLAPVHQRAHPGGYQPIP
jgi:hypothetical protein